MSLCDFCFDVSIENIFHFQAAREASQGPGQLQRPRQAVDSMSGRVKHSRQGVKQIFSQYSDPVKHNFVMPQGHCMPIAKAGPYTYNAIFAFSVPKPVRSTFFRLEPRLPSLGASRVPAVAAAKNGSLHKQVGGPLCRGQRTRKQRRRRVEDSRHQGRLSQGKAEIIMFYSLFYVLNVSKRLGLERIRLFGFQICIWANLVA